MTMKLSDYHRRKEIRTTQYFKYVYGWRLRTCSACSGSGYYDNADSPFCNNCGGTGKEHYRGPKSLEKDI